MRYCVLFVVMMSVYAADIRVAPIGGDFSQIQDALDVAQPGDRILVETGTYNEQLTFPISGNSVNGAISLEAAPGHSPILDGTGFGSGSMITIENRSFIRVVGLEIQNLTGANDGSGIRVIGSGTDIDLMDNVIHDILGMHAMGITVYGTEAQPIERIQITGNLIHDCEPATSEALTLNGNVTDFVVSGNTVRDVNNIGIDFIGGETDINPNPLLVARNGVCSDNQVMRARSSYGGGFAAGIYVDGGQNIIIERNIVTESDLGIEIGAENAGTVTSLITVRNNLVYNNDKVGLVFGGYDVSVGRTQQCEFTNNTFYLNDTLQEGFGELWIQYADQNIIRNNLFLGIPGQVITYSEGGNFNNQLDHNIWYVLPSGSAEFEWQSVNYIDFAAFVAGSGQESNGQWANPLLEDPANGDFHLTDPSPAQDSGDPASTTALAGTIDIDLQPRIQGGRIDRGADEFNIIPPCFPAIYAEWQGPPLGACAQTPQMDIRPLIALITQSCSCP